MIDLSEYTDTEAGTLAAARLDLAHTLLDLAAGMIGAELDDGASFTSRLPRLSDGAAAVTLAHGTLAGAIALLRDAKREVWRDRCRDIGADPDAPWPTYPRSEDDPRCDLIESSDALLDRARAWGSTLPDDWDEQIGRMLREVAP